MKHCIVRENLKMRREYFTRLCEVRILGLIETKGVSGFEHLQRDEGADRGEGARENVRDSGNSPSRPDTVWKLHHNRLAFRTDLAFGR